MTIMADHIRVLRAEAKALRLEADRNAKSEAADCQTFVTARVILLSLAMAKHEAADQLEAEEPTLRRDDSQVTYNPHPKGRIHRA